MPPESLLLRVVFLLLFSFSQTPKSFADNEYLSIDSVNSKTKTDNGRKSFEKRYGVSPLKYLKLVRLENARSLLESGLYSVCEAAELSGFTDAKYFSREFSRHYGKSPSSFIKCFINKKTG